VLNFLSFSIFVYSWSNKAVSSEVIDAVLTAWEMERHHAAERHLYPEVIPALKQIKIDHPGVVIGAVTDGKANPMVRVWLLVLFFRLLFFLLTHTCISNTIPTLGYFLRSS